MHKGKGNFDWRSPLWISLGVVAVFAIWWIYSAYLVGQGNSAYLFPDPIMVFGRFFYDLTVLKVWQAYGWTLLRLIISFLISLLFGSVLGLLAGLYRPVKLFLKPFIVILRTLPTAAITFILILLSGARWAPVTLGILVMFPIIYEAALRGVEEVGDDIRNELALEGGFRRPNAVFEVIIPMASPYAMVGVVSSLGLGMKVMIMAEVLCGGRTAEGLGRIIYVAANIDLDSVEVMSICLLAIITIGLVDLGVFFLKRFLSKKGWMREEKAKA